MWLQSAFPKVLCGVFLAYLQTLAVLLIKRNLDLNKRLLLSQCRVASVFDHTVFQATPRVFSVHHRISSKSSLSRSSWPF